MSNSSTKTSDICIAIILSTYNGEKYLPELLDSLLRQTYCDFKIHIRDDNSKDGTKEIIVSYKKKYPEKFVLLDWESSQNLGYAKSFLRLLEMVEADFYFFCDQDDIWYKEKIGTILNELAQQSEIPLLFHSDVEYLNRSGSSKTYFQLANLKKLKNKFIFRGIVQGCSMAFNRKAREKILEFKSVSTGHDLLAYFIAKAYGEVKTIDKPLLLYRLHQDNTVGMGGLGSKSMPLVLIKDILKYFWNPNPYRKIILSHYDYLNLSIAVRKIDNSLINSEIYLFEEISKLSYLARKKWFFNHFYPFYRGFFEGMVQLILF